MAAVIALLVCNCMAQSAAPSPTPPQRAHHPEMPGGERSIKGCLSKDANGDYFLVLTHGRKVHLTSSSDVMSHVGQQVKLNGAFIDAPEAETKPATPASNSQSNARGKQHMVREFRVVKVDMLSATCAAPPVKTK